MLTPLLVRQSEIAQTTGEKETNRENTIGIEISAQIPMRRRKSLAFELVIDSVIDFVLLEQRGTLSLGVESDACAGGSLTGPG